MPHAIRRQRALDVLGHVGLRDRVHHKPNEMSGGQRQRVAIARSLANGASVLLADEPTGNLDSENADLILDLILGLRREQNFTLILVTHDLGIARQAARRPSMSMSASGRSGASGARGAIFRATGAVARWRAIRASKAVRSVSSVA